MMIAVITLIILIFVNAFFAASEIALISLNENKVQQMAKSGNKKFGMLNNLISDPSRFLSTIQIGITLAGFLASAFAADFFATPLATWIDTLGLPMAYSTIHTISIVVITVILAYFTLVLGELVPKKLALQKSEQISLAIVRPLTLLFRIFYPIVNILTISTNAVVRLLRGDPNANEEEITEDEIRMMVDIGSERGVINKDEKVMINRIFELDDKNVSHIITHRTDMIVLSVDASFKETISVIHNHPYSRFPVYEGQVDNIVGILHQKDLFYHIDRFNEEDFDLKKIIREPYFVIEAIKIDHLFAIMKEENIHITIVLDEYGGTKGLITIEDIIEEIVGEIASENSYLNKEEEPIKRIGLNKYAVKGIVSLYELEEILKIGLPVREFETLNGFLIDQSGYIPGQDEDVVIQFNHAEFKISKTVENRIELITVTINEQMTAVT